MQIFVCTGRIGKDFEVLFSSGGKAYTKNCVAVNRFTKDEEGHYETDWINFTAFGKTAEYCGNYLAKGRKVAITGRWQSHTYVSKEGVKVTAWDVIVDNIEGTESKPVSVDGTNATQSKQPVKKTAVGAPEVDPFAEEYD